MPSLPFIHKAALALGGLSMSVFFLGVSGLLSPAHLAAAALVFAVALAFSCRGASLKGPGAHSAVEKALFAACLLSVLVIVPLALLPPAVRDELISHLAIPRLYLAEGRISEIAHIGFSYLPMNIDLLYLVPMSLGSDIAPRLLHLVFAVLTAALVYSFLLPVAGRPWALAGFLVYMTTPLVANLSRMAYIDHGAAFYSMLSFMAALRYRDEDSMKWLAVSAIAMGLGLGAKYNVLISFLLVAVFIFAFSMRRGGPARAFRDAVIYCALAVAIFSPWLIRNWAWTGSPLYPLFEAAASSVARGEGVHITGEMAPMGKRLLLYGESVVDIVLLPFRIFIEGADNSIERFDGVLNPLFLAFIPLAFLKRERDTRLLAAYSFLFFLLAALTVDLVTRYLMPVVPALVILVTLGMRAALGSKMLRWPAAALAAAMLVFSANYTVGLYRTTGAMEYLAGGMDRDSYLRDRLPDYDLVSYSNANLPEKAKVMLLFAGDRGYYWDREYVYGDRTGLFLRAMVERSADAGALSGEFRGRYGATHLVVHEAIFQRFVNDNFTGEELKVLVSFFNERTSRLYSSGGYSLFELR